MRRRLDSDLHDCTACPHHYLAVIKGQLHLDDPPLALYDEAPWVELVEARQRVCEIEQRVRAACVNEPLDGVEIELGRELDRMCQGDDQYEADAWDRIEEALRAHAATLERKP